MTTSLRAASDREGGTEGWQKQDGLGGRDPSRHTDKENPRVGEGVRTLDFELEMVLPIVAQSNAAEIVGTKLFSSRLVSMSNTAGPG